MEIEDAGLITETKRDDVGMIGDRHCQPTNLRFPDNFLDFVHVLDFLFESSHDVCLYVENCDLRSEIFIQLTIGDYDSTQHHKSSEHTDQNLVAWEDGTFHVLIIVCGQPAGCPYNPIP
jgi:hypothetical protein